MNETEIQNVVQASAPTSSTTTILVKSNLLGVGAEELGQILMKSFFYTLTQDEQSLPTTLVFLNTGVRLTSEGSPVLAHLQDLAAKGVEVLSCGTCLDFYGLKEKLVVGRVSNMYEINEKLKAAGKVITL
jgi:selenium metabolism protein YedF